jgi:hypothetical protein
MARFGSVDFDERILNAIRDDKLVIFAGAGVSMGSPSNLPSFWKLAKDIASGTGLEPTEPLDRFLGTLNNKGIDVHQRAIEPLSPEESKPNDLHRNIIKLFRDSNRIKLITTNFDLLFEEAYKELQNDDSFSEAPNIYRAPALPQGYDFNGIVYVHGALPQLNTHRAKDMVLTDADFGRAYLTEGWARRFLVDVFREFTVLFIGYSHNDAIMNYLARALPADRLSGRFALTDEKGNWKLLGIEPIIFKKHVGSSTPYKELYGSIKQLAEVTSRGVLEWNQRIIELSKTSPTDDDALKGEIRHILERDDATKLFTKHVRGEEWLAWLEEQGHLNTLFDNRTLNDREEMIAKWLAEHYSNTHPYSLFKILFKHNLELNPKFWEELGRYIGKNQILERRTFEQWADIIIASKPTRTRHNIPVYKSVFSWIAQESKKYGSSLVVLKMFMALNDYDITAEIYKTDDDENERILTEYQIHSENTYVVWKEYVKPELEHIAIPLLEYTTSYISDLSNRLKLWGYVWELGEHMPAIELTEDRQEEEEKRDNEQKAINTLISAAREAMEILANSNTESLEFWISRLIRSDAPILRRLAIHASTISKIRTADTQLKWIIDNNLLGGGPEHQDYHEHHEAYRAAAISYKNSTDATRREFVQHILSINIQSDINDESESKRLSKKAAFDWLNWLLKNEPDCHIAKFEINNIKNTYPGFEPSENSEFPPKHRDINFPFFISTYGKPETKERLLSKSPSEQIRYLKQYGGSGERRDYNRRFLLNHVTDACKENTDWGIDLASQLTKSEYWSSDLWKCIFTGLCTSEISHDQCEKILLICNNKLLMENHHQHISLFLEGQSRIKDGNIFHPKLEGMAYGISNVLWDLIQQESYYEPSDDLIKIADASTPGRLASFLINMATLESKHTKPKNAGLSGEYKHMFEIMIANTLKSREPCKTVILRNISRLYFVDKDWTRRYIFPLLGKQNNNSLNEFAWSGLIKNNHLPNPIGNELQEELLLGLECIFDRIQRKEILRIYAGVVVTSETNPNNDLIPKLFSKINEEEVSVFSWELKHAILKPIQKIDRNKTWGRWLRQYIDNRSQNIPKIISKIESRILIEIILRIFYDNPDAAILITKLPEAYLPNNAELYRKVRNSPILEEHPNEAAQLLIHLSKSIKIGDYIEDFVVAIDTVLMKVDGILRRKLEEAKALLP